MTCVPSLQTQKDVCLDKSKACSVGKHVMTVSGKMQDKHFCFSTVVQAHMHDQMFLQ